MPLTFSIIIPTYNRASYLEEALKSALAQDYKFVEIIVADNASTDYTRCVVEHLADARVSYYSQPQNVGMVANWRTAVHDWSNGEFFMILCDDDYLIDNHYVTKVAELLEHHRGVSAVIANGYILTDADQSLKQVNFPYGDVTPGNTFFLNHGNVRPLNSMLCNTFFHRMQTLESDVFSNSKNISLDWELLYKLALRGNIGFIHSYASVYRVHPGAICCEGFDVERLINCLDYLVRPYLLAKRKHIFSDWDFLRRNPRYLAKVYISRLLQALYARPWLREPLTICIRGAVFFLRVLGR